MNEQIANDLTGLRREEEKAFADGDFAALAKALAQAAELYQDPAEKAGTMYRAGLAGLRAGDKKLAADLLGAVKDAPSWERLSRISLLEIHFQEAEWDKAIGVIDREIDDGAVWDEETLRLEKARIMAFRLGRVDEAGAELDAALSRNSASPMALWIKLSLAVRAGAWEEAAGLYQKIVELCQAEPDEALLSSAAYRLGQVQEFRFKKPEDARQLYEKLVEGAAPPRWPASPCSRSRRPPGNGRAPKRTWPGSSTRSGPRTKKTPRP